MNIDKLREEIEYDEGSVGKIYLDHLGLATFGIGHLVTEWDAEYGWEVGTLGDILEVKGGTTPSTKEPSFWDGEFHWTSPRDLSNLQFPLLLNTDKKITKEGLKKISSGLLPKGTYFLHVNTENGNVVKRFIKN